MPHVVVDEELTAVLEYLYERNSATGSDQRSRRVYLDHRQPATSCSYRVALSGMGFLPDEQIV
jgi:hypothetical protein